MHTNTPLRLLLLGGLLFYILGTLIAAMPKPQAVRPCPAQAVARRHYRSLPVSATVYYPTGQPTYDGTAIIRKAIPHLAWCAISPDVLRKSGWHMGDTLLVSGGQLPCYFKGLYVLHDLTNRRLRNRVDILVPAGSYSDRWDKVKIRRFTINELRL